MSIALSSEGPEEPREKPPLPADTTRKTKAPRHRKGKTVRYYNGAERKP